jgi:hypothetical protein
MAFRVEVLAVLCCYSMAIAGEAATITYYSVVGPGVATRAIQTRSSIV